MSYVFNLIITMVVLTFEIRLLRSKVVWFALIRDYVRFDKIV